MKLSTILMTTAALVCTTAGVKAQEESGAVYTMTNAAANSIAVFYRNADGMLHWQANVPTGGAGTGVGLGSNGAVTLTADRHWLLAVNAGSNEISVFSALGIPSLVSKVPSGGTSPISIAESDGLVYVLNAGGTSNITGFWLGGNGSLTAIPNSTRPLSEASPNAPQVGFSFDGSVLIVTEKATNLIDVYAVKPDGTTTGPTIQPSHGQTPFGFQFDHRGHLVVSEAFGGAPGASAVSSYMVTSTDALRVLNGSVPNHQGSSCWLVITKDGRWAYVADTSSNMITGYSVGYYGKLSLLTPNGASAPAGNKPGDLALSRHNRFLYVVNGGDGTIEGWRVAADGSLVPLGTFGHLALGLTGLAAY